MIRFPFRVITAPVLLVILAACSPPTTVGSSGDIPRPVVTEHTRVFTVVPEGRPGTAADDRGRSLEQIVGFVSALRTQTRITIFAADPAQTAAIRRTLRERLGTMHAVIPAGEGWPTRDLQSAVIAISWATVSVPGCPDWARADDLSSARLHSSNFGCATSQAFAAMLDRPLDLSTPSALGAADGTREALAIERYRTDKVKEPTVGGGFSP